MTLAPMALAEDGPVTSAEKLAWPGTQPPGRPGHSGGSGPPRPASDFWSVAPLEMGSIRLGFLSGAYWVGSTVTVPFPTGTRPLFRLSELGHHPAAPLTCQCATVTSAAGAAATYWRGPLLLC